MAQSQQGQIPPPNPSSPPTAPQAEVQPAENHRPSKPDESESTPEDSSTSDVIPLPPPLNVRWVHAGAQHLDLPIVPITVASTTYKAFSADESKRIDERWSTFSGDERQRIVNDWGKDDGELSRTVKGKDVEGKERRGSNVSVGGQRPFPSELREKPTSTQYQSHEEQPEPEEIVAKELTYNEILQKAQAEYKNLELIAGVPVSQDSLFEVDLETLSLHPVFWAHTGPRVPVLRGTWFATDETRPCNWQLAEELEKGFMEIKPWLPSYKHEFATAMTLGQAAEEKLKYHLPSKFGQGLSVLFEDEEKGRLITVNLRTGTLTYLSRALYSSIRARPTGTYVYRGFNAALTANGRDDDLAGPKRGVNDSRRGSMSSPVAEKPSKRPASIVGSLSKDLGFSNHGKPTIEPQVDGLNGVTKDLADLASPSDSIQRNRAAMEEENAPITDSNDDDAPCTDLVLVIHGIGQQLAAQYESYNFVYAGNQLRQIVRKQSANPGLSSIIRERRCQVLPVQWRASMKIDVEENEEEKAHEMGNRFTMADITLQKSIPYVRDLTNAVLLDLPLFMSQHRQKMIEAVCLQANKLYRLWVARHPGFDTYGRVHVIGHSLGSALATHILSNQPTQMPSMSNLPKKVITETRDRFLFNTSNLFLVGSPLGIFLHLDQAQLMPRKGRERTMNSPQDEAIDRSGKFGCMAIDSLYNVFYQSDPIAYSLNAAVDSKLARTKPPLAITSVTAPFYSTVSESLSSIKQYLPTYLGGSTSEKKVRRPGTIRLPSGLEMLGPSGAERLEGSRGERRFSALNPHGNIDFYLPGSAVSDYLDMITSHASYWSDESFAAFILSEIYSTRLDLMRTGLSLMR